MDVGAVIKKARSRAGLTQAQLAEAAGTSQPTIAAYEANRKSPSLSTLDRIVRATGHLLQVSVRDVTPIEGALLARMRDEAITIRRLAKARGLRNIRVFGSTARGEDSATSDIDILVDFDAERFGMLPLAGFAHDVKTLMGRDVDVTTTSLLKDHVRRRAIAEAIPL
jgi:predicted nucleotidyltransferase/DNA-binding XRE family transcriptional regulator